MQKPTTRPLLLRGKVVHPDGSARDRYILVRDGVIEAVGRRRPPLTSHAVYVKTDSEDWIFPGLLDLHTHSTYNLLPLWKPPDAPFDNRFGWRWHSEAYKKEVKGVFKRFDPRENDKFREILAVAAELQAVAGGTTVLQEDAYLDLDLALEPEQRLLLCRDTANPAELQLGGGEIMSVVDFFRPDKETGLPAPTDNVDRYVALRDRKLHATLAHLAEGRSGFGHDRGPDPYSRREFEAFMAHPAFADAGAVRTSPLAIVHGCGIDTDDPGDVEFLRERDISVIWSPVSNLLLYGDTLDAEALLDAGINVALGSDWSPSGSKHVWAEAKFARFYFDVIGSMVSDEQIFQMVTTNAGRCLGVPHLGRIEAGGLADFFILRSPLESDNPLEVFFATTDRHVRATIIGGRPIYGAADFLEKFGLELQPLPAVEGSAVENKAVHLPRELGVDVDRDLGRFERFLKDLPENVYRSNLLASSDKLYRERIQELKADTVRFGWGVQEWRRKRRKQQASRG